MLPPLIPFNLEASGIILKAMDELTFAKKRKAFCNDDVDEAKRSRSIAGEGCCPIELDEDINIENTAVARVQDDRMLSSMEEMLVVPMEYIFREVPSVAAARSSQSTPAHEATSTTTMHMSASRRRSQKPLLSRSEAQCFLQINLLAHEIDSMTAVSTTALHQRLQWSSLASSLQRTDHPFLRPLLPILYQLHEYLPASTLQQVTSALNHRVVGELRRNVLQLRQCSEQNWTLAETLQDSAGDLGQVLAEEKRKLSDVQEEICQRVEYVLMLSSNNPNSREDETTSSSSSWRRSDGSTNMCSMKEYCDCIFQCHLTEQAENNADDDDDEILEEPTDTASLSACPARDCKGDDDELLEEPKEAAMSFGTSPANDNLPVWHATQAGTTFAATRASIATVTGTTVAASATDPKTPISVSTTRNLASRLLLDLSSSSKKPVPSSRASEEKENASSQSSSSQHSSQHRTTPSGVESVLTATAASADVVGEEDYFRSQSAADVLNALATAATTRMAWRGESSSQSPAS